MPHSAQKLFIYRHLQYKWSRLLVSPRLNSGSVSVEGVTSRAKYISNFVANEFFDFSAGRCEVLSRIKLLWRFPQRLANRCRHCQSKVGVNIDLRTTDATRD